jgi:hypothetical protein
MILALKGRDMGNSKVFKIVLALTGRLILGGFVPQGVALGCYVSALQAGL